MPIRMAYDHFITKVTPPPPAIALTAGIVGAGLFLPRGSEGLGLPAPTAFHAFTFYWDTSGAAVTSDPRAYFMRSKREQKQNSGCGGWRIHSSAATVQVQHATKDNSDAVLLGVFGHIELDNS